MAIMTRLIGINNSPTLMVPSNSISSSSRVNILLPKQRSHYSTTTTNCLCVKSHDSTSNSLSQSSDQLISTVDQKLLKVLKSEIKSMVPKYLSECNNIDEFVPTKPLAYFPFKIEPGGTHFDLILKREFRGEEIEVGVRFPSVYYSHDLYTDDVGLNMRISRKDGTKVGVRVRGSAHHDLIVKHFRISFANDPSSPPVFPYFSPHCPPEFEELPEDVQSCIMEFIGIRGINSANIDFLLKLNPETREWYHSYKAELRSVQAFENFVIS